MLFSLDFPSASRLLLSPNLLHESSVTQPLQAAPRHINQLGLLKHVSQTVISHTSGVWESKVKVLAGLAPSEAPLLGLQDCAKPALFGAGSQDPDPCLPDGGCSPGCAPALPIP